MRMALLLLYAFVISLALGSNYAPADEMDDWCAQVKKPSSVVICSDPELKQQVSARNRLFEAARSKLNPEAYRALTDEQSRWVKSYTAKCGLPVDSPGTLATPAAPSLVECFKRESRLRTANLTARLSDSFSTAAVAPPAHTPPPIPSPPPSSPTPMHAEDTGYDLFISCDQDRSNSAAFFGCLRYVNGILDGAMTMQSIQGDRKFCPSTTVQVGQMVLVFEDWAKKHPAELGHDAAMAVLAAMIDSFPCVPRNASANALPEPTQPAPADTLLGK